MIKQEIKMKLLNTTFLGHLSLWLTGELIGWTDLCCLSSSFNIFNHHLLWNRLTDWSQISSGASTGWGKESLFTGSSSHGKNGCHANICKKKKTLQILLRNKRADCHETWYAAIGTGPSQIIQKMAYFRPMSKMCLWGKSEKCGFFWKQL